MRPRPRPLVPRASVARAHQYLPPSQFAPLPVPRAAVRARPLQYLEAAVVRRSRARVLAPRASVRARPLQHLEVAALRRGPARVFFPRALFSRNHCSTLSWPPFAADAHRPTVSSARPRRCKLLSVLRHPCFAASSGLSSFTPPNSPSASRTASVKEAKRSSCSFERIGSTAKASGGSQSDSSESVRRVSGAIRSDSRVWPPRSSSGAMPVFARARIVV